MHLNVSTPSSSVLFLTIILLSAQVSIFLCVGNENCVVCSKPFQCGNIHNVSYPFWGGDRPDYCGHPGLELTCQGDEPQITIMSHLVNTTLNFSILSYAWNLENLTLYYHCTRIANLSSGFLSQFNCTNNGTDVVNYYVTASAFGNLSAEVQDGLRSCHSNVIVPAFYTAVQTIESNPTPETLILPLGNGFGLKWDATIASKCEKCNDSGGRCGYNESLSQFTCYCSDHTDALTCLLSSMKQKQTKCFD
ncbi:hypothetical protein CRYUN_Cryun33cG0017700 [Craigia yunnanensis]